MKRIRQKGLLPQIYRLVAVGMIIIGIITFISQNLIATYSVMNKTKGLAVEAIGEALDSLSEYPAHRWLLLYWFEHAGELDIEYDVSFEEGTVTEEKCRLLSQKYPDLQIRYATDEEIEALPEEDQKLYAEIVYTWVLSRFNEIKQNLQCSFLCLIVTRNEEARNPFESSVYIFSGADEGTTRGDNYGEAYPLGKTVAMTETTGLSEVMKRGVLYARDNPGAGTPDRIFSEKLKDAGSYVDYYMCMELIGDLAFLIGATYDRGDIVTTIRVQVWTGTILLWLFQFALVMIIINHLLRYGVKPLRKVTDNIRKYTETKDSETVCRNIRKVLDGNNARAIRQNEIGQLANDFMGMTAEIDEYVDEIAAVTAEKQRIAVELNVAAEIQQSLLQTEFPSEETFSLYATMRPAREVGGDFYDFFLIDKNHLGLVIADVSDKGVPAALFMAIAKTLIKNRAMMGEEPGEILENVNAQLSENNEAGYFVTVWLAVIDLSTGKGLAANAGHEHPALCRGDASYELIIYRHSPVLGMIQGIPIMQHAFSLEAGDSIFVYTDGVPEANNAAGQQFGTERMLRALNEARSKSPKELLAHVSDAVDSFVGDAPQFDDTTMMCFQYYGPSGKKEQAHKASPGT